LTQITPKNPALPESTPRPPGPSGPPKEDRFPLTDIQAAYVVGRSQLIELGGRQQYYVELDAVGFDPVRAEEAINLVVRRHEQLRSVMGVDGLQRVMNPAKTPRVRVTVVDLTGQQRDRQESVIRQIRSRLLEQSIDPTGWPLFDVVACRVRQHRARIHLRCSLMLLDAPSIRTVITDWERFYVAPSAELPPVRQTFRDWRMSLLRHEQTEAYQEMWRYWEERLDLLPEAPQLPLAQQPAGIPAVDFQGRTSHLTKQQWQGFCANFRRHRVLPATALMHVYAEVLGAWAAAPHFCLNVVHLNLVARHPGEDVVGQRTATLPLEVDLRVSEDFWERARHLQRRLWRDMANSDVTGVRISRVLAARHGWTQRAALPYVFTSNQGPGWDTEPSEGGPVFRFLGRIQHTPQVLIDDQIRDTRDGGIASNLDFVDDAFPPGLPELMAESYQAMLTALAEPGSADLQPDPVPVTHRATVADINSGGAAIPAGLLQDGFLRQANANPAATALITNHETLSYGELEERSRSVAHWLREHGAGSGELVPVIMSKGWEQVVAVLGVLRAGAAYCPVDARLPGSRIDQLLGDIGARFVLGQSYRGVDVAADQCSCLDVDLVQPTNRALSTPATSPTDLAYVIYTSGSTGRPKGVMIEHLAALNTLTDVNERVALRPGDRVFGISSLSFDLSVWDIFGTLSAGATLVIPDSSAQPDPVEWTATAARHRVSVWNSVPAIAEMLVEVAEARPDIKRPPMRAFLLSGDWVPTALPARMRGIWPGVRITALGGATEASIWSNSYEIGEVDPGWSNIPYGHPLRNQTMKVLDHRLDVRPPWATGRIYIGGAGLARGYWRDEERTAERFIAHPRTGERLYWTGDLGRYWPDGTIEFLGREDRQVKIQGFRVEPGEVEAALRKHCDVHDCVVCADSGPGGHTRLVALAVSAPERQLDSAVLIAHLGSCLPHYMIPERIAVVDRLPLTPNGKVDVERALALASAAAEGQAEEAGEQDSLVTRLRELWAEILQLPSVGLDSNFFELGGNSLMALRMINRVRLEFGAELPMAQVFEAPTLRLLSKRIRQGGQPRNCMIELSPGTGQPLFLFHVMGGSLAKYFPLAEAWTGPVHGFVSRPLVEQTNAAFATDLPTMAAAYREELVRHQPEGPYVLGGWSMGGTIAYEVARQLRNLGHQTRLFMIDSQIIKGTPPPLTAEARHLAFLTVLAFAPPPETAASAIRAAEPGDTARVARETAIRHGLLPAEVDLDGYEWLMRVMEHELALLAAYEPAPLDQPALLFVAAEEPNRADPVPAWQAACPALSVEFVPCDHYTISEDARFRHFARRVQDWLAATPPE
jgi:amino acid adenylation domain-containing protein